jgi:hypothetical protein
MGGIVRSRLMYLVSALSLFGCSGGSSSSGGGGGTPPPTPAAVAGKWEVVATSTANPGATWPNTLIEANLSQTGTSVSAGTAATDLAAFYSNGNTNWGVEIPSENVCEGTGETISGTVSGQTFSFTFTETGPGGTYTVTGTATVNANGQLLTGTYTSAAACGFPNDSGNITGTLIGSVAGNYLVTFDDESTASVTVNEDANHNVTLSGTYQAQAFTLSGEAIGGAVIVSGEIPAFGQDTYYGAYLTSQLVSFFPQINNLATKPGDFLFINSEGGIALVQKQ